MSINVSAITGISRVTRPVSSDTQIGVLQRRLETLDKQRASAASSSDETATYRLQALTQQMGLLQTQIGQLQQAASAAAAQRATVEAPEEEEAPAVDDTSETSSASSAPPAIAATPDEEATDVTQETQAAQRDAAAVARARADGSLVGTNVDTYV